MFYRTTDGYGISFLILVVDLVEVWANRILILKLTLPF